MSAVTDWETLSSGTGSHTLNREDSLQQRVQVLLIVCTGATCPEPADKSLAFEHRPYQSTLLQSTLRPMFGDLSAMSRLPGSWEAQQLMVRTRCLCQERCCAPRQADVACFTRRSPSKDTYSVSVAATQLACPLKAATVCPALARCQTAYQASQAATQLPYPALQVLQHPQGAGSHRDRGRPSHQEEEGAGSCTGS